MPSTEVVADINALWVASSRVLDAVDALPASAGVTREHVIWRMHPRALIAMKAGPRFIEDGALVLVGAEATHGGIVMQWKLFGIPVLEDRTADGPRLEITVDRVVQVNLYG